MTWEYLGALGPGFFLAFGSSSRRTEHGKKTTFILIGIPICVYLAICCQGLTVITTIYSLTRDWTRIGEVRDENLTWCRLLQRRHHVLSVSGPPSQLAALDYSWL